MKIYEIEKVKTAIEKMHKAEEAYYKCVPWDGEQPYFEYRKYYDSLADNLHHAKLNLYVGLPVQFITTFIIECVLVYVGY